MSIPTVILRTSPLRIRPLTNLLPLLFLMLLAVPHRAAGQITIPHVFSSGQTISSSQMNTNFSTLGSNACNRAACVLTGALQGTSATFSSTLTVTGAVTLSSTLSVSGASTLAAVASGAITATGNVAPATGATYNSGGAAARWLTTYTGALDASGNILDSTGNLTINDALDVSGAVALSSTLAVTGNVTLSGLLSASGSTAGVRSHSLTNTSNDITALVQLALVNDTGGTAVIRMLSSTFTNAADTLVINNLATNGPQIYVVNGTGTFTFLGGRVNSNTSQPGFLCFNSADDSPVSSVVNIDCDTEVYDNTSSFSADVFTAPVTGTYLLCATVKMTNTLAYDLDLVTSNRSYDMKDQTLETATGVRTLQTCVFADMDSADTASISLNAVGGSGYTVYGSASPYRTYFSGRLVL